MCGCRLVGSSKTKRFSENVVISAPTTATMPANAPSAANSATSAPVMSRRVPPRARSSANSFRRWSRLDWMDAISTSNPAHSTRASTSSTAWATWVMMRRRWVMSWSTSMTETVGWRESSSLRNAFRSEGRWKLVM